MDDVLFSGDTLFVGRTGRTVDKKSDPRELYKSVYNKILTLPEKITIYPGHDYGPRSSITIRENIKISPLLQAVDEDDFLIKMKEYEINRKTGS